MGEAGWWVGGIEEIGEVVDCSLAREYRQVVVIIQYIILQRLAEMR